MQMLDDICSINSESVSRQKKRKKRGRILYSSRRELERSRMRASKHLSRLTDIEIPVGVRIDFGGEEVTNLASLQEMVAAEDAPQAIREDNVKVIEGVATRSIVRHCSFIPVSMFIA